MAEFDGRLVAPFTVINRATVDLGVPYDALLAATQIYISSHIVPFSGNFGKVTKSPVEIPGTWPCYFLDDADAAGALAYHDLTDDNFPVIKTFVKPSLGVPGGVSVSFTHEIVETLGDPAINDWRGPWKGKFRAKEDADPVEETFFNITVGGVPVACSNFVRPEYYESWRLTGARFDEMKLVKHPFDILPGGYQILIGSDGKITQAFGSQDKMDRFNKKDKRGRRGEARIARARQFVQSTHFNSSGPIEQVVEEAQP